MHHKVEIKSEKNGKEMFVILFMDNGYFLKGKNIYNSVGKMPKLQQKNKKNSFLTTEKCK